jgi:hypothetical protein
MPIVGQFGSLAGFGVFPGGALESIATITVGSGGSASLAFSDIPGGFQHLQFRMLYRNTSNNGGSSRAVKTTINSDTGNNYARHLLYGDGASAAAEAASSQPQAEVGTFTLSTDTASTFSATVLDVLDYASTSKNKTLRYFAGRDHNGSGLALLGSALWMSTSAITSVTFATYGNNFAQHSTVALYGVRA